MKTCLSNRPQRALGLLAGALGALAGCGEPVESERALPGALLSACYDPAPMLTDEGLGQPDVWRNPDPSEVCEVPSADIEPCLPSNLEYVASVYGQTYARAGDLEPNEPVFRLVALVERVGPSNVDVMVVDEGGELMTGVPVAWGWPGTQVEGRTEANGRVGFPMAASAYLPTCGAGGPHFIHVRQPGEDGELIASDRVDGIGMLGGTEHRHFDLVFQLTNHFEQPEPEDPTDPPVEDPPEEDPTDPGDPDDPQDPNDPDEEPADPEDPSDPTDPDDDSNEEEPAQDAGSEQDPTDATSSDEGGCTHAPAGGAGEGAWWIVLGATLVGWRRRRRVSASGS